MLPSLWSLVPLAAAVAATLPAAAQQQVFSTADGPLTLSHISQLKQQSSFQEGQPAYTHVLNPDFPASRIRIKETTGWCDVNSTQSYAGYFDTDGYGKSIFFYFFTSRSDPDNDPVVYWGNGGPGASSALGLFNELGPCQWNLKTKTMDVNPYSWNERANVFFIDQPSSVGFSYSASGQKTVSTTEEAAVDVETFVRMFFSTFKEFEGRAFHISGESYGGRYLPIFASAVHDGNRLSIAQGRTPINLKSVLIGNGMTDTYTMMRGYVTQQCTAVSGIGPIQSIGVCVKLWEALPRCEKMMKASCVDSFDIIGCQAAVAFCGSITTAPFFTLGYNWYDISEYCGTQEKCETSVRSEEVVEYLNLPSTRATLGIDPSFGNFTGSSRAISQAFGGSMDLYHNTKYYITSLLEAGIKILIYVGDVDFACNAVGNALWTEELEWSGGNGFRKEELREWSVPGVEESAGVIKSFGGLTFMTVKGAGHLVPLNKPAESLHMLQSWVDEKEI